MCYASVITNGQLLKCYRSDNNIFLLPPLSFIDCCLVAV